MVSVDNGLVEFSFFRPEAKTVWLAGDFNDWKCEHPMTRRSDGYWETTLELSAGVYKFRYCADGVWYTDYAAFGVEPGQFGNDSVVNVLAPRLRVCVPSTAGIAAA